MKNFINEFKEFASRGNVVDLAVGVILGAAFGKIVTSLVEDLIMPPIGVLIGGVNFADIKFVMKPAVLNELGVIITPEAAVKFGNFIQISFNFVIIALAVFLMVKGINSLKRVQDKKDKVIEKAAAIVTPEVQLLTEIRDLLKK